jgi:hypothetical protein
MERRLVLTTAAATGLWRLRVAERTRRDNTTRDNMAMMALMLMMVYLYVDRVLFVVG